MFFFLEKYVERGNISLPRGVAQNPRGVAQNPRGVAFTPGDAEFRFDRAKNTLEI